MKQNYLLIKSKIFVDPHGSADDGGVEKEIVFGISWDEIYRESKLDKNKGLSYCDGEWLDTEELDGSEDGYNAEYTLYELKKISEEKALEYKEIIKNYNKIK